MIYIETAITENLSLELQGIDYKRITYFSIVDGLVFL